MLFTLYPSTMSSNNDVNVKYVFLCIVHKSAL